MNPEIALFTAQECARRLRVSPETVRAWERRGLIPSLRFSPKVIRYDLSKVFAALAIQSKGGDRRGK